MEVDRILIVGLGSIGRRHAKLLREIVPAATLAALRHRLVDVDASVDTSVDICVSTIEQALEFSPQMAIVANPASHHLEVALALARAGVHLLVEKPISDSTDAVNELIQECETRQVCLMTGYNLRFLPSLQEFRHHLQCGRIGQVYTVRAEIGQWLPSWRPDTDYRKTVSAQRALGGGVLLELSHEIDYLRWLFGDAEWVTAVKLKASNLEIDVEDSAHVLIGFGHETEGNAIVASLNMDFIRHDRTRTCTVIGEKGTLKWDAVSGTVEVFAAGADKWETLASGQDQMNKSYIDELNHFLACIEDGAAPRISGQDGLKVLEVIAAINQSADAERAVYLQTATVPGDSA